MTDEPRLDIITRNVRPIISKGRSYWIAFYNGDEELRNYGFGDTKQEAITDLLENYERLLS